MSADDGTAGVSIVTLMVRDAQGHTRQQSLRCVVPHRRRFIAMVFAIAALVVAPGVLAAPPAGIPAGAEPAAVVAIIDGDTIDVRLADGADATVRLIGIDTPETKYPGRPVACFGPEAAAHTAKLIKPGREVWLERDVSDVDRYDRLLRYVWVEKNDGDVYQLNAVLVRDGYAAAVAYQPDTTYAPAYEQLQTEAQLAGKGLWTGCPDLSLAFPALGESAAPAEASIGLAASSECDPSYPTVCLPSSPDLNCPEIPFTNFPVTGADPHEVDRDRDGVGCET